jgi:hypothetical protein
LSVVVIFNDPLISKITSYSLLPTRRIFLMLLLHFLSFLLTFLQVDYCHFLRKEK